MTSTVVTDETQVRDVLARLVTGMRAGDVDGLIARFTPDVVQYSLAPPLRQPEARDADRLAAWFGTFAGPVDYDLTDLEVFVGGDIAYAHGIARLTATPAGMTEPFTLWFRLTVGLRRDAEGWKVEHEHQSVPFHMDGSFRAAVDLEP
ncbi:YybH family protein [Labedaea rhizosphaerae]|uniref:Ketosteroid isomerase-like protein n=1 Tax=Labedaea rhizosphaerae TaxID=598644 RepID=A0A4R6S3S0_LABRH|nr:nuclear transport factor 2 family protein [Labedaea rhizosphaerae]TDP93933.1 ketosteroid isomerase-like protein [Labedaea rhizosphaerae]